MKHVLELTDDRVAVEVVVSRAGEVVAVDRMSPPRPYYVGEDPRTCDFVIPTEKLGVQRMKLFDADADGSTVLLPSKFQSERVLASDRTDAASLSAAIDDLSFQMRRCERGNLRAIWSDFTTATSDSRRGTRHTATCYVTVPLRIRCPTCGAQLEGHVTTKGEGSSTDGAREAGAEARSNALEEARREAFLARCPHCRHRDRARLGRFALSCLIALVAFLVVPAIFLYAPPRGKVHISGWILIPSLAAAAVLSHRLTTWAGAARVRLRRIAPCADDAPPDDDKPWQEDPPDGGVRTVSFVGVNASIERMRLAARSGSAVDPKSKSQEGYVGHALVTFVVFMVFAVRGLFDGDNLLLMLVSVFLVNSMGPLIVALLRYLVNPAWRPEASDLIGEFVLSMSRTEFTVAGPGVTRLSWPLDAMTRFSGIQSLTLLRRDGKEVILPCRVLSGTHAALVERLNEWLADPNGIDV